MAHVAALSRTPAGPGPAESEDAFSCPEHSDRPAELFCRRCRCCVCALCPVLGVHRGHPVGLASEEAAHVQKVTQECLKQLAAKKQQQVDNRSQIEDAAEQLKAHAESSKTWLTGKFTELRLLLEEEEALAKKFIDKNTQLALQAYREQIKSCEDQIDVLNSLSDRVWSISQETSPVQLLQEFTATEQKMKQHMALEELRHPVPQSFEPVKTFFKGLMEAMQNMMQTPLEVRLKDNPVLPPEATPLCSCRQSLLGLCYASAMSALRSQLEWPSPFPLPLPGQGPPLPWGLHSYAHLGSLSTSPWAHSPPWMSTPLPFPSRACPVSHLGCS